MRAFPLRVVLSLLTCRLLITEGGEAVIQDFISFMEGSHGSRTAAKTPRFRASLCAELVRRQPTLEGVVNSFTPSDWYVWAAKQEAAIGKELAFQPLTQEEYTALYI
ncbi:hypothetical protein KBB27_01495 [Patescibacteria group bacterium]|nr:hypothetical protein [Patescibacteria group bacterium]